MMTQQEDQRALPTAVLISGGGTTLKNLLHYQQAGRLAADFRYVISSKPDAAGLDYARQANIPIQVISRRSFACPEDHCQAVFAPLREAGVELVVMGGYLELLLIPEDYQNRVINIHPSLIPSFCGKGFYGLRVHRAAVDYGVKVSGCTVHFVDNEFDRGPIIAQRVCPVEADDTAEQLQARVFQQECELLPEVVQMIAEGRVEIRGRRVVVHPRTAE
ncbi:MAG: phosphoribosylglycinamide formyltransferase [bacterium]|nr:phosphoribosylglycinamide formyltransferase [bacterium]